MKRKIICLTDAEINLIRGSLIHFLKTKEAEVFKRRIRTADQINTKLNNAALVTADQLDNLCHCIENSLPSDQEGADLLGNTRTVKATEAALQRLVSSFYECTSSISISRMSSADACAMSNPSSSSAAFAGIDARTAS